MVDPQQQPAQQQQRRHSNRSSQQNSRLGSPTAPNAPAMRRSSAIAEDAVMLDGGAAEAEDAAGYDTAPEDTAPMHEDAENHQQKQSEQQQRRRPVPISTDGGAVKDAAAAGDGTVANAAPLKRGQLAKDEERRGIIQCRHVTNDSQRESMILLTGLKNIYQKQLPKMPREYIARLVYDRNHDSMAIVKKGLKVVGGITYRVFNDRKFAEIVFCAITSSEQVKVRSGVHPVLYQEVFMYSPHI